MLAQAATLRDWAEQWDREPQEGAVEMGFLLRRAAGLASQIGGVPDLGVEAAYDGSIPAPKPTEALRTDAE